MRALEIEFVKGVPYMNGKPAQEWVDLAASEGSRAVECLRRARKAEDALRVVVNHWHAFGPEHGFDEVIERVASPLVTPNEPDHARRKASRGAQS